MFNTLQFIYLPGNLTLLVMDWKINMRSFRKSTASSHNWTTHLTVKEATRKWTIPKPVWIHPKYIAIDTFTQ